MRVPLNTAHGMMVDSSTMQALLYSLGIVPLGISLPYSGLVAVNVSLPYFHQRGVIAHECGHRVLHAGESRFFLEQHTLYLPGRKELEANLFALLYLMEWDKLGLEECGGDLFRFADFYGLPRRAAEAVMSYARLDFGEKLCG